jgi:hypothetical protein
MTFDIGQNLTTVLIALLAAIPAIIAAWFARKAQMQSSTTSAQVNGRMTEMLNLTRVASHNEGLALGQAGATAAPLPVAPLVEPPKVA